ncbi:carboxypeptidase-like regulatory domain-containing protein [Mucilaginibacter celer]|uniref:Carboxypeptidase regulatory-like domain-containing protein n=1 Tax=Mucilaginibacter celer TaxID=2305508 RepID=A0A494VS07_9SPHI|nr:hypothetical protein [Mucilaginibacter celer]AYL94155.1 hypothetical protein HYN43_002080 [Mucilaginibacter celer]
MSTTNNKTKIWISIIGLLGVIIPAIIKFYPWKDSKSLPAANSTLIVSGSIVDEATNKSIEQAEISVVGRNEIYYSEHNGNFRLNIKDSISSVRIRVVKKHYHTYDKSFDIPNSNVIIPLTSE